MSPLLYLLTCVLLPDEQVSDEDDSLERVIDTRTVGDDAVCDSDSAPT